MMNERLVFMRHESFFCRGVKGRREVHKGVQFAFLGGCGDRDVNLVWDFFVLFGKQCMAIVMEFKNSRNAVQGPAMVHKF